MRALAEHERRRNAETMPDYKLNLELAQLGPLPEEQRRLRAALRGDRNATNHFFLATQAMVPRESFFNDENLGRIIAAAA